MTTKSNPRLFQISNAIRERHLYLIGKTRTGKTNLLKTLLLQDMRRGAGVAFLDPHGDAAYELLGNVPKARIPDTIYFDPSSPHAPAFNLFRLPYPPHKLTEDIVSLFKMFFGDSWGYRMEHILRMSTLTLLTDPIPHTLKDLQTLLLNPTYRDTLTRHHPNEPIRTFWEREFPTMEKGAINPILNKLSSFLLPSSPMERIFSQKDNDLNFPEILNTQKIFIANLAKGKLGDEPSRLLGGLITAGIQQAALGRADFSPSQRKDFHFYVDEFHNYIITSFEVILTESAKYRCFLTLAHQNLGQIPTSLERAIFGNVATLVSFQVSAEDAATIQKEMHRKETQRTRIVWRRPSMNEWRSLDEFLSYASNILTQHRMQYDILARSAPEPVWRSDYSSRRDVLARTMGTLRRPDISVELLRDISKERFWFLTRPLFDDCTFRTLAAPAFTYPEPDDFTNLPKYHAFCRVERTSNIFKFRTIPAPPPNETIRAAILTLAQERAAERPSAEEATHQQETTQRQTPPSVSPETKPKRTTKKKSPPLLPTDEDEEFIVR